MAGEVNKGLDVLGLLAIVAGIYLIYKIVGPASTKTTFVPTSVTFGNTYVTSGNLVTASGQVLGAMATLSQGKDDAGNLYVYVNGGTYLAQPSGLNYTAIPVTQTNAPPGSTAAGGTGQTTFAASNAPANWGTAPTGAT